MFNKTKQSNNSNKICREQDIKILRLIYYYVRKQLLLSACLSHRISVCLSVCPSHGWISQKWSKL